MRRLASIALSVITLASGVFTAVNLTASPAPAEPHRIAATVTVKADRTRVEEDDRTFDCRKHGNPRTGGRTCGVRIDPTPNDGRSNFIRVNVVFDKKGRAVDAYPYGTRRH